MEKTSPVSKEESSSPNKAESTSAAEVGVGKDTMDPIENQNGNSNKEAKTTLPLETDAAGGVTTEGKIPNVEGKDGGVEKETKEEDKGDAENPAANTVPAQAAYGTSVVREEEDESNGKEPSSTPLIASEEKADAMKEEKVDKMDAEVKSDTEAKGTASEPAVKDDTPKATPVAENSGAADVIPESNAADAATKSAVEKTPETENKTTDVVAESEVPASTPSELKYSVGTIVFKLFFDSWYFGHVVSVDAGEKIYKVVYEDGDREELEEPEVEQTVVRLNGEVAVTSATPVPLVDSEPAVMEWKPANLGLTGTAAIVLHNDLYKHLDRQLLVQYIKRRKEEQASKDLESRDVAAAEAKSPKRFKRTVIKQKPKGKGPPTLKKPVLKKPSPKVGAKAKQSSKVVAKAKQSPKVVAKAKQSPKVVAKPKQSPKVAAKQKQSPKVAAKQKQSPKVAAKTKPIPSPKPKKPSTPKAQTETPKAFPVYPLGTVVYKYFAPDWFFGFVGKIDSKARLYGVCYEDGDKEELNEREMDRLVVKLANGTPATTAVTPDIPDDQWNSDEAVEVTSPGTVDVCSTERYRNLDKKFLEKYIEKRRRDLTEEIQSHRRQVEETARKRAAFAESFSPSKRARTSTGSASPMLNMSRSAFDPETGKLTDRVCEFFWFVHERHMMWVRRNKDDYLPSKEPEDGESTLVLTHDPILRSYSFCNVYRELDRGTAFFHGHILNLWETKESWTDQEWLETVLWASYVYRLVNRVETFVELGIPTLDQVDDYKKRATEYAQKKDVQFFTGAHQTLPLGTYFSNLRSLSRSDAKILHEKASELVTAKDARACLDILMTLTGVASFLAWQLFCDLQESGCLKQCANDNFCILGPGARKGIDIIFQGSETDYNAEALALVQVQKWAFSQLGVQFPLWQGRSLTVKEIEHALCEYSKWCALKIGKFTKVRWFKSKGEMDADKPCHTCKIVKDEGALCDTCIEFYCSCCVPPPPLELESWLCPRCTKMETTFRVKEPEKKSQKPSDVDISAKKEESSDTQLVSAESAEMDAKKPEKNSAKKEESSDTQLVSAESTEMDAKKPEKNSAENEESSDAQLVSAEPTVMDAKKPEKNAETIRAPESTDMDVEKAEATKGL